MKKFRKNFGKIICFGAIVVMLLKVGTLSKRVTEESSKRLDLEIENEKLKEDIDEMVMEIEGINEKDRYIDKLERERKELRKEMERIDRLYLCSW